MFKNSVHTLIDQRPKVVPGQTFSEKDFHPTKPAEAMLILQASED